MRPCLFIVVLSWKPQIVFNRIRRNGSFSKGIVLRCPNHRRILPYDVYRRAQVIILIVDQLRRAFCIKEGNHLTSSIP